MFKQKIRIRMHPNQEPAWYQNLVKEAETAAMLEGTGAYLLNRVDLNIRTRLSPFKATWHPYGPWYDFDNVPLVVFSDWDLMMQCIEEYSHAPL